MAPFLNDTFTGTDGTNLESHTGETGATWTIHPTRTGSAKIQTNRIQAGGAGVTRLYYASGIPASADYDISAVIRKVTGVNSAGVMGRLSITADTGYLALFNNSGFSLFSFVTGVSTQLGSTYADVPANGTDRTVLLRMRGDQISVYVDGVLRVGPVTDTAITAAGRAGYRSGGGTTTTGYHLDSISASDFVLFTDSPSGTLGLSGTVTEGKVSTDSPTGTVGTTGASSDAVTRTDTPSGVLGLSGASVDAKVGVALPAGTLALAGQLSDAQSRSVTVNGTVAAQGTLAEQVVRSSILGGGLVLSGAAVDLIRRASSPDGTVPLAGVNLEGGTMVRIRLGARLASFPHVARVHASRADTRVAAVPLELAVDGGDSTRRVVADG